MKHLIIALFCALLMPLIVACSSDGEQKKTSTAHADASDRAYPIDPEDARKLRHGKMGGEEGLKLFGDDEGGSSKGATLGVNSFLWRATLDTLSFVPLASVDPRGGVIITDWYEAQDAKSERFKINALLLDTRLRSDALRVSVFKQVLKGDRWQDAEVDPSVARDLEDKILTRARELRIASGR